MPDKNTNSTQTPHHTTAHPPETPPHVHMSHYRLFQDSWVGTTPTVEARGAKGRAAQLQAVNVTDFDKTNVGGKKRHHTRLWH